MAADFRSVALVRLTAVLAGVCVAGTLAVTRAAADQQADQKADQKVAQKRGDDKRPVYHSRPRRRSGFSPLRVHASVDVRGGPDDSADFYCPAIEWDWGDGTSLGKLGGLRPLRGRHQHHPAPVLRRSHLPAGRRLPGDVPAQAEGRASSRRPAPTSRSARAFATILATDVSRGRRDGGRAGPRPRAAPRCTSCATAPPPSTIPRSSPKSSSCCRASIDAGDSHALLLPELLGDPATWRLETAMRYDSHRPQAAAGRGPLRQAAPADAGLPLAVRVQPRQLRAAAPREPGALRLRAGARARERPPATCALRARTPRPRQPREP